ncbi:hypothetical protein [Bdellovibrio sp. HCB288]|uniref:hypothetical protein n=1 Tax=Bdellovibrio sp. HCB288 TaxID=3394355 RepID=UPI0039B6BA88
MRQSLKVLTAAIAMSSLAACASSPAKTAEAEHVTVWEVTETPFLRAVKKSITGEKAQDITVQMPVKGKETKTR